MLYECKDDKGACFDIDFISAIGGIDVKSNFFDGVFVTDIVDYYFFVHMKTGGTVKVVVGDCIIAEHEGLSKERKEKCRKKINKIRKDLIKAWKEKQHG